MVPEEKVCKRLGLAVEEDLVALDTEMDIAAAAEVLEELLGHVVLHQRGPLSRDGYPDGGDPHSVSSSGLQSLRFEEAEEVLHRRVQLPLEGLVVLALGVHAPQELLSVRVLGDQVLELFSVEAAEEEEDGL